MSKKSFILALVTLVTGASVGVIAGQHLSGAASHESASNLQAQFIHSFCGQSGDSGAAQPHLPAEVVKALELTAAQQADIDRIGTEACATIARIHEQMLGVLTPEQRAKVTEMHGEGHSPSSIHDFFKRLHGGK